MINIFFITFLSFIVIYWFLVQKQNPHRIFFSFKIIKNEQKSLVFIKLCLKKLYSQHLRQQQKTFPPIQTSQWKSYPIKYLFRSFGEFFSSFVIYIYLCCYMRIWEFIQLIYFFIRLIIQENIKRSQNAPPRIFHRLLRCQVVLNKSLF